jgi:alpha-ketoglutarate-dependent sulfate ester dioxygenase
MTTLTTTGTHFEFRKVTSSIGAEVQGIDLSGRLDGDTVAALRLALNRHRALVFSDVHLDDAGQQRFVNSFGPLTSAHPTVPSLDGALHVLPVDSERGKSNHWHTDVTFVVNPPQLSSLRSLVVPSYGGETLVADSGAAYRALPVPLARFADTLWAVHSNLYGYAVPDPLDEAAAERRKVFTSTEYESAHPVVRVHPLTGERGLFIGGFARRIIGLSQDESRDVLRLLESYVTRPEHILRWRWSENQLLLFDNRITQHYAIDNYDDQRRRLHRVTVAGDIPTGVDGDRSYSIKGDASENTEVVEVSAAA